MGVTYPIPRSTRLLSVTATAGQTVFGPYQYMLFDAADVAVFVNGEQVYDGFTVEPASPANAFPAWFTITFDTGLDLNDTVAALGRRVHERLTDVTRDGAIRSVPLEKELDRIGVVLQELRRDTDNLLTEQVDYPFGVLQRANNLSDLLDHAAATDNLLFNRGLTNSSPRSVKTVLKDWCFATEWLNVSAAGVECGAALQLALNEATAAGKLLRFPKGQYKSNSKLTLPLGCKIEGEDRDSTFIVGDHASNTLIEMTGFNAGRNISFGHTVTRNAGAKTIDIGSTGEIALEHFHLSDCGDGITIGATASIITLDDFKIRRPKAATGVGIRVQGGTLLEMTRAIIGPNDGAAYFAGLLVEACGDLALNDFTVGGGGQGMAVTPGLNKAAVSIRGQKVWLDNNLGIGLYVKPTSNGTVARCDLQQSWGSSTTTGAAAGAIFDASDGTSVIDDFKLTEWNGYLNDGPAIKFIDRAGGGLKNIEVIDPAIAGNGIGIDFDLACGTNAVRVRGGKIGATGGGGVNTIGVRLRNACNHIAFDNVALDGNTTQVDIDSSVTGNDIVFRDCPGYEPVLTPAAITGTNENYNPAGLHYANVLVVTSAAAAALGGLAAPGYDKRLVVRNGNASGGAQISLVASSGSSTAANRFAVFTHLPLNGQDEVVLRYDSAAQRWNLEGAQAIPISYLDTDTSLAANSDTRVATQKATKAYVDAIVASADAMIFKGVIDCSANPNYPAADRGHTYRVSVAGKIGGASGTNVEAGDLLLCLTDGTVSGNQATVGSAWSIAQTNLDGAVIGPASATDNHVALFDGTTGKLIKSAGTAFAALALLASPTFTGTPAAPTAAVDTNTTQIATTAFVVAQASAAGDGTPAMNGTAARGTSLHYARADHVHPTDTSRAPTASPTFTGTVNLSVTTQMNGSSPNLRFIDTNTAVDISFTNQASAFRIDNTSVNTPWQLAMTSPYLVTQLGGIKAFSGTAIPAGGTAASGFMFSSTANFGVFFGSGAPSLSAAQGSLYLRSDGSSTSTRLYVNTNGSTGWTNVTTAA